MEPGIFTPTPIDVNDRDHRLRSGHQLRVILARRCRVGLYYRPYRPFLVFVTNCSMHKTLNNYLNSHDPQAN